MIRTEGTGRPSNTRSLHGPRTSMTYADHSLKDDPASAACRAERERRKLIGRHRAMVFDSLVFDTERADKSQMTSSI